MSHWQSFHTDSGHSDFHLLAGELEDELYRRDGAMADANRALNKIDILDRVVLVYDQERPVGCGGFRRYADFSTEIKRMYVIPDYRRKQVASVILRELEKLAAKDGFGEILLETGRNQPEAISFYLRHGYLQIENFGRYAGSENSVCFKKALVHD